MIDLTETTRNLFLTVVTDDTKELKGKFSLLLESPIELGILNQTKNSILQT